MRLASLAVAAIAAGAATQPGPLHAQDTGGWELRAGLQTVSAQVCDAGGSCFGVVCRSGGGWSPVWFAEVQAQAEGDVPPPIFAIRTEAGGRFALTDLTAAAGATGEVRRYEGGIAPEDQALLEALQAGTDVTLDPGRDFAVAEFSLLASRWAVTEALDLCEAGGPDIGTEVPADEAEGEAAAADQ